MTETQSQPTREVVGTFSDRAHFEAAVEELVRGGFARADLSVLSSHESIDMVGREGRDWRDVLTALVSEVKYEGPLVTAGLIALVAGPIAAPVAALVAAGVGGMAFKEFLDEITAIPDSEDFARALAAGAVILWVMVGDAEAEAKAQALLAANGAQNIHVFERKGRG